MTELTANPKIARVRDPAVPDTLTENELFARFPMIKNPHNAKADFDGCMFETFGADHDQVRASDPAFVRTYGTDDEGLLCIFSGYHYVNRLGYFISTIPVDDGVTYVVPLEESTAGVVRRTWGLCCPNCDDDRELAVEVAVEPFTGFLPVLPEGLFIKPTYRDDSPCVCFACDWSGAVADARAGGDGEGHHV